MERIIAFVQNLTAWKNPKVLQRDTNKSVNLWKCAWDLGVNVKKGIYELAKLKIGLNYRFTFWPNAIDFSAFFFLVWSQFI